MPKATRRLDQSFKTMRAFAHDFCRMLGPRYHHRWRALAYARSLTILGTWLVLLVGLTYVAPLFGAPLLLLFGWGLWDGVRSNRQLWDLARRRRSWPLDIRKRLYWDGAFFIFWDYWRIIDIPELRELRKNYRTDQLIAFLLFVPIVFFAYLIHVLGTYLVSLTALGSH